MMVMKKQATNGHDELSTVLAEARRAAGLRQQEAAQAAGISQNKISRVEHGKGLLKPKEASALLSAYRIHGAERRRIMTLVEATQAQYVSSRIILQRGAHHFQERMRLLDEQSQLVRSFASTAVLGIFQTPAYMRVVFTQRMTEEDAALAIESRIARQQILSDVTRRWILLQSEGALRWNLGGAEVMVEQLEHIAAAINRSNVSFGLIPWHTAADVLPDDFHLYDQRAVLVGTRSGTAIIGEATELEAYSKLFEKYQRLAVYGDRARAELQRITDEYRDLQ
jgi:transcriptional regulator with XRE-family HTH domain